MNGRRGSGSPAVDFPASSAAVPLQAGEEPGLGGTIILIRSVLVEVLMGDIRNHPNIKLRGIHAMLRPIRAKSSPARRA